MISVVIVSHNAAASLDKCLARLPEALEGSSWEGLVVDNASSDRSSAVVRPPFRLLASGENKGFAWACNHGARNAAGDLLCFLNPDTVPTPGSLTRLARRLEGDPTIGVVGPALTGSGGEVQHSFFRFPSWTRPLLNFASLRPLFSLGYSLEGKRGREGGPVDWLSGACLLARRSAFESIGGFDERYFLYFEDTDLCRRMWRRGWSVHYAPEAKVVHEGGGSGGGERLKRERNRSRRIYFSTHHPGLRSLWEEFLTRRSERR